MLNPQYGGNSIGCVWRMVLADNFCIHERKVKETYEHRFVEMFGEVKKQQFTNFSNHPSANTKFDSQHRSPYTLVVV